MIHPMSVVLFAIFVSLVSASNRRAAITTSYSNTTASPTCSECYVYKPSGSIEFAWPKVTFDVQVLATVIYQVDTVYHTTLTTTKTVTATEAEGAVVTDELSFWQSLMGTTDLNVESHVPTITYKAHVYTAPGEYTVVTTTLTTGEGYFNMMFLAATIGYTSTTGSNSCTTGGPSSQFALTATAGYDVPIGFYDWLSLLPESVSHCSTEGPILPATAVQAVSALTETTTEYGNFVASQSSTGYSKSSSTPTPAKQTTSASPKQTTAAGQTSPYSSLKQTAATVQPTPKVESSPPLSLAPTLSAPTTQPQAVVISGQTITAGASGITIGGTRVSLATGGFLYAGSEPLVPVTTAPPVVIAGVTVIPGAPAITISGKAISLASSGSAIVIGSSTFTASGPAVTVDGIVISLSPSESERVDGSSTSGAYGQLIWSGLGGTETGFATGSVSISGYTGAARKEHELDYRWLSFGVALLVAITW